MPGQLKPTAKCPQCGDPLLALVDTSSSERLIREYFHERVAGRPRRRRRCRVQFTDQFQRERAGMERYALEVHRGR